MGRVYSEQFLALDGGTGTYLVPASARAVLRDLTLSTNGSAAGGVARVYGTLDGFTYILESLDEPSVRSTTWQGRIVLPETTEFGLQVSAGICAVLSGYLLGVDP